MTGPKIESATGTASGHGTASAVGQGFSRPPADHEIYNLIGRVSAEWAYLEHTLDQIIWDLAEIDPRVGACITAQLMGVWPRSLSIIAMLTQRQASAPEAKPLIKEIKALGDKARDPGDDRNRFIHDPWYAEQHDPTLTVQHRSMPKTDRMFGLKEVGRAEIEVLLKQIAALSDRAIALRNKISAMLKASRERPT